MHDNLGGRAFSFFILLIVAGVLIQLLRLIKTLISCESLLAQEAIWGYLEGLVCGLCDFFGLWLLLRSLCAFVDVFWVL